MRGVRQAGRIAVAVLGCALAAGAGATVRKGPMPPGSGHARNVARLLTIANATYDPMDPGRVPPDASRAVVGLKNELRDLVAESIASFPVDRVEPWAVRKRVADALATAGIELGVERPDDVEETNPWTVREVGIVRPPEHHDLLAALVTLDVPCAIDRSLYVFERGETSWSPVLTLDSGPYGSVFAAWELQYAISPPDVSGHWFVAAVAVHPWCSSTIGDKTFEIVRPGPDPASPDVLLRIRDSVRYTEPCEVDATRDTVTLRFTSSYALETTGREFIRHYRVEGTTVRRSGPLAQTPGFFIDEWLALPGSEAERWMAPRADPSVRAWHDVLEQPGDYRLDFEDPCGDGKTWEVGLSKWPPTCGDDAPEPPGPGLTNRVYFTVREVGDDYELVAVDSSPSPTCLRPTHACERPRPGDDETEEAP